MEKLDDNSEFALSTKNVKLCRKMPSLLLETTRTLGEILPIFLKIIFCLAYIMLQRPYIVTLCFIIYLCYSSVYVQSESRVSVYK